MPPIYPALSSKSAPPPWTPITQTPRIPQNIPAAGTPIFFVDVTTDNKIAVFQDANGNFFIKKSGMASLPAPVGQKVGEG
ncbi:hypothetical protein, partial [Streptomyces javensis]|uniref:hypothetical protein n=1 Tax=Streptomyces javensis TaxID=114698 RepID=UPI001BE4C2DE